MDKIEIKEKFDEVYQKNVLSMMKKKIMKKSKWMKIN